MISVRVTVLKGGNEADALMMRAQVRQKVVESRGAGGGAEAFLLGREREEAAILVLRVVKDVGGMFDWRKECRNMRCGRLWENEEIGIVRRRKKAR
jgi:hypothetical protein